MSNCLFCKIIDGDIPSTKVYEDEYVYAFDDINPVAPVHTLVIPKKHIESIADISSDDSEYIVRCMLGIKEVARIKGVEDSGYRVISNCGENAGQTVFHLHFHVIGGRQLGEKLI